MIKMKQASVSITLLFIAVWMTACTGQISMPTGPNAAWTLVVIGDSSMWGLGEAFANQIEKDMGVKVIIEDFTLGALSAGEVLSALQSGKSERAILEALPAALKEAEVVMMFVNPNDSINAEHPMDFSGCFFGNAPNACQEDTFSQYQSDLEAIWWKIIELRKGKPTILRATDIYNPIINLWEKNGVFVACDVCWTNMSSANRKAAESYGIPFLSRYDAFNGLTHKENPREKSYILDDGEHLSEEGAAFTSQLFSEMGYEPTITK